MAITMASSGLREMNVMNVYRQEAQNMMKKLWVNLLNNNIYEVSTTTISRQFYIS